MPPTGSPATGPVRPATAFAKRHGPLAKLRSATPRDGLDSTMTRTLTKPPPPPEEPGCEAGRVAPGEAPVGASRAARSALVTLTQSTRPDAANGVPGDRTRPAGYGIRKTS